MISQDGIDDRVQSQSAVHVAKGISRQRGGEHRRDERAATATFNELTNTDLQKFKTFANNVFPMWGADGMIYFASETRRHVQPLADGVEGRRAAAGDELQERRRVLPVDLARRKATSSSSTTSTCTRSTCRAESRKSSTSRWRSIPRTSTSTCSTAQSRAEGFSISPSGDYMAVDYHGEIVIVPTEQGVGEKTQVTNSPWRERAEESIRRTAARSPTSPTRAASSRSGCTTSPAARGRS